MKMILSRLVAVREVPVFLALLLVLIVTGIANPQFVSASGAQDIFLGVAVIATLCVGQTFVITMRHIDLSVGSTAGFTAYMIGKVSGDHHGLGISLLVALAIGLLVGAVNGFLVAYLRLPSLVVTLASLWIVRGIFNQVAGGNTITDNQVPSALGYLGRHSFAYIPYIFIIAFALVLFASFIMHSSRPARDLYAMGSNPPASELAGIPVIKRTFFAFLASGAVSGLGGAILLARFHSADSNSGLGLELNVIAACVVGGVAVAGGVGTPYGALIGALLLQSITQALGALGVSQFWQLAVNGVLLISAISLDRYLTLRIKPTRILRVKS
jgi:rhamnose transport system permease protein